MFTDLSGYTALSQRDEAQALKLLEEHREIMRPLFTKFGGREIKTMGDGFLVEFGSSLEATKCAYEAQLALHRRNRDHPPNFRILLKIGIHAGDVIHKAGDVYGDAVNIASRVQAFSPPGGVCLTARVADDIRNKTPFRIVGLGRKTAKNVELPLELYRVLMPWEEGDTQSVAPVTTPRNRVAVLPFMNISPSRHDEYFADGLTEEMISRLSLVKGLEVIARTSVMTYKKRVKGIAEIARELNVGTVIEGSVRKSGKRIRVSVQLIDTASEAHIWSASYDRKLTDIFSIQSEIASKAASYMRLNLVGRVPGPSTREETSSVTAYTHFLRGRELMREGGPRNIKEATSLFGKAVRLDPSFARAYSELSNCYYQLADSGLAPWKVSMKKAMRFAKIALRLDSELAEAHLALANIHFGGDDLPGTEREARRAIELNPNLTAPYAMLATASAMRGDIESAVKLVETYYELDPLRPTNALDLGIIYLYSGRDELALQHWQSSADLFPGRVHRHLAEYYASKGNYELASQLLVRSRKDFPVSPYYHWLSGYVAGMQGDRQGALRAIRALKKCGSKESRLNWLAFVQYALGDLDSFFELLQRASDSHSLDVLRLMYCPLFRKARIDPRYAQLVASVRKKFEPREKE